MDIRIVVPTETGVLLLRIDQIDAVEPYRNWLIIHASDGREFRIRSKLGELFASLQQHGFIRMSRSAIVRSGAIVSVELGVAAGGRGGRGAQLVLESGRKFAVGRSYQSDARALWKTGLVNLREMWQQDSEANPAIGRKTPMPGQRRGRGARRSAAEVTRRADEVLAAL